MSELEKAIEGNEKAQAELKALRRKADSLDGLETELKEAKSYKSRAAKVDALETKIAKLEGEGGSTEQYWKDEIRKAANDRDAAKKALKEARSNFETQKQKWETDRTNERKRNALSTALRGAGVSDKLIKYAVSEFGLDEIEVDEQGNVPDMAEKASAFLDEHDEFKGIPKVSGGFVAGKGNHGKIKTDKNGNVDGHSVVSNALESLQKGVG